MQALELERRRSALDKIERGELKNFQATLRKDQATAARVGHDHMPALKLELRPGGRRAVLFKAATRYTGELAREYGRARRGEGTVKMTHQERLRSIFARANAGDTRDHATQSDIGSAASSPSPRQPQMPDPPKKPPEPPERPTKQPQDFTRKDGRSDGSHQR